MIAIFIYLYFFYHHFLFPAQLVGGFSFSDLLDKPWSQVSCLSPPGTSLELLSRVGFSIPTARRFSSDVANPRSLSRFPRINFYARKKSLLVRTYESVHSVRTEPTKLISVGTKITYQTTGDAVIYSTTPTQETCAINRSCRFYGPHPATCARSYKIRNRSALKGQHV